MNNIEFYKNIYTNYSTYDKLKHFQKYEIKKIQLLKINLVEDIAEDEELDILGTVKEYKRKIKESKRNKKDNEYLLNIINNIDVIREKKEREELKKKDKNLYKLLYSKWYDMKSRCYNINNKDYSYYGKRGIKVCKEWLNSFVAFYNWSVNNGYNPNNTNTIDRIDSNKGYSPENCRYVNFLYNTRYINGKEYSGRELSSVKLYFKAKQNNNPLEYETVKARIRNNWSEEKIINTKVAKMDITLNRLKQYISQNTNQESMKKIYGRFIADNKENINILEKGQKLYFDYLQQIEKRKTKDKWKQFYLTKRTI